MPKLRVTHEPRSHRTRKLRVKLRRVSQNNRKKELKAERDQLKLENREQGLNVSGNGRGMHLAKSPPESEHMRKIRAMRRFYNKQMPVLQCSNCSFSQQCPQFRAGYECAFLPFLNSHKVESVEDLVGYMKELIGANMRRTHLTLLMETMTGAAPSTEVSEALNLAFTQMVQLHERLTDQGSTTVEIDDEEGTIIGRLFGNLDRLIVDTQEAKAKPIEVIAEVSRESAEVPEVFFGFEDQTQDALIREHKVSDKAKNSHSIPGESMVVSSAKI